MAEKLSDYFCTPTDIAIEWGAKGEKEVKKKANYISRKFKSILEQMDFEKEYIKFYKIKHTTDIDQKVDTENNKRRSYIFWNRDNTSEQLKELFDIFKETKIIMTAEDRDKVKKILVDILPVCRNIDDVIMLSYIIDSQSELYKLKNLLKEISRLEIIINPHGNKWLLKTSTKIKSITKELDVIIPANKDNAKDMTLWLDIGRSYYERRDEVKKKVDAYYRDNLQKGYFEREVFVSQKQCDNMWRGIYTREYELIEEWRDKWVFIIDEIKKIKRIENYDIKKTLQEYINGFAGEEKYPSESNKKRITNKKDGLEQCGELVDDICKKCGEKLCSKKERDYIKETAFKELTDIGTKVKEEQNAYCKETENIDS